MATIAVNVQRRESTSQTSHESLETDLERARRLAHLLDAQFSIAGFRFGLDAIVGLVPAVGDTIAMLAGLYPLHVAKKHGLGKQWERRMVANLLLDYVVGMVPVLGDVFDATFKANIKNVKLLERAVRDRQARVRGR